MRILLKDGDIMRVKRWFALKLLLWALRIALKRPASRSIPRSGSKGKAVDCYSVDLRTLDGIHYDILVDSISNNAIVGLFWSGNSYEYGGSIVYNLLGKFEFSACHYIGLIEVRYTSVVGFIFQETLRIPYIQIFFSELRQRIFNLKTLYRSNRIKILQILIDMRLKADTDDGISFILGDKGHSSFEIMKILYGERIFAHPQHDWLSARLDLTLESLVTSADVSEENYKFHAVGKALETISLFEEDNRRHRDQMILNWVIAILTFALVIVGILPFILEYMTAPAVPAA